MIDRKEKLPGDETFRLSYLICMCRKMYALIKFKVLTRLKRRITL